MVMLPTEEKVKAHTCPKCDGVLRFDFGFAKYFGPEAPDGCERKS